MKSHPKPQSVLGPLISSGNKIPGPTITRGCRFPVQDDNKWRELDCRPKHTRKETDSMPDGKISKE